jgi:hypothetical protein
MAMTTLPPFFADILEILGATNFCNPRDLFRPVHRLFQLFVRNKDIMIIIHVRNKIGHVNSTEGFYVYKRATNKNQLCKQFARFFNWSY